MTQLHLWRGASDRTTVHGSSPRLSPRRSIGARKRRTVALALSPLLATAGLAAVSSPADAAVTIGAITAFPDRDMVEAAGYNPGEPITIQVLDETGAQIGITHGTGPVV